MNYDLPTVYYMVATHQVYGASQKYALQTLDYSVANILCDAYPYFSFYLQNEKDDNRERRELIASNCIPTSARKPLCEIREGESRQLKQFNKSVTRKVVVNPDYSIGENGVDQFYLKHFEGYLSRGDYVKLIHVKKMLNQASVIYPCLNEYRINQLLSGESPVIQYQ